LSLYEFLYDTKGDYTDWRLPENRIEAFSRVTHTRLLEGDLDHHHTGKVICDMMGLSDDEKVLYALYFGQSYRNHWAMIALQKDFFNMKEDSVVEWHNAHWQQMKYGNDTKWNVRKFPDFVQDIKKKIGPNLYEYFGNVANSGNTSENYYALNKALRELYSIGRMTAWLAQQTLFEFFQWDIDHWDQQLYDDGTWSQYDSLCYLFDRLDIARSQKTDSGIVKYSPSKENIRLMEDKTYELMEYVNSRIPYKVDIYNVESVECEYRKTAYGPKIKEFTFWTTNELVEQYESLKNLWKDDDQVNWKPYVTGFMTKGDNLIDYGYSKEYFRVMIDHGFNLNTHHHFEDEPNAHTLLNLPKYETNSARVMKADWNGWFTSQEQKELREKYDPRRYLIL
jgi:hypothetical protein